MTSQVLVLLLVVAALVVGVIAWAASQENAPKQTPRPLETLPRKTPDWFSSTTLPPPPAPPSIPTVIYNAQTNAALSQVRASVSRREAEVEAALIRFQATGFRALTELHYQAFQTADTAHALYRSTLASARSVSSSIESLDRYLAGLETGVARGDGRYVSSKSNSLATRRQLVATAQALQGQTAELLAGVRRLNANTHTLKERIRTECGQRGRDWYAKLEARKRDS